jgi:hypothetical protein
MDWLASDELRALRRLQRETVAVLGIPRTGNRPASPFVFVSEQGSPFITADLAGMIERAAAAADLFADDEFTP